MTKKKCNCEHCTCDPRDKYDPWKAKIHRDYCEGKKLAPTDRIPIGEKVKLSTGETGVVKGKSWNFYQVAVDQLGGMIRSFEDKHVEIVE